MSKTIEVGGTEYSPEQFELLHRQAEHVYEMFQSPGWRIFMRTVETEKEKLIAHYDYARTEQDLFTNQGRREFAEKIFGGRKDVLSEAEKSLMQKWTEVYKETQKKAFELDPSATEL